MSTLLLRLLLGAGPLLLAEEARPHDVNSCEKLEEYDPDLFQLIDEAFKKPTVRYERYDKR